MKTIVSVLGFLALAAAAAAQPPTLLWSFQGNGGIECITSVPDIDGDGGPDVVFEGYGNGPSGVNHVFAIRGRSAGTGQVLWSARPIGGASSGGGEGDNCLRLGPDLNADGFPDLLLATAWGGRTAYSLSGRTGSTLWSFDTYVRTPPAPPESGWVYAMDNLGTDVTGDGVPEIVFCCGSFNDYCYCVDGSNGALVWAYDGQDAFLDVRSSQDINNDGIRDVVACLGDDAVPEQVVALSGANGARLWSCPIGNALWNLTFIDDITGDGIREIVPSTWRTTLYCINGANGAVPWSVATPAQQRVAALDDVNGDGVKDVAVGFNTTSACRVFSGLDGAMLWNQTTSDWTWAVDRIADCTDDGVNDVVVGDFDGKVYLLDGVTGSVVWNWTNPTGDKIMTIRGVADLSGNGAPDVVAGTQLLLSTPTGGDVYALEGREGSTAVPDPAGSIPDVTLAQAFPNPFRDRTTLRLVTERSGHLEVLLCGPDGRVVRLLASRFAEAGEPLALSWDGRADGGAELPAGVYFVRATLEGTDLAHRRVVLVR